MPLLLKAISRPEIKGRVRLHIAGDGPYRSRWEKLAQKLHVHDQCIWHGWLPQDKTLELLDSCDVLAFTALMEGTPTTAKQALSLGLPILCFEHCGFGEVLNEECGIAIPVVNPSSAIHDFSSALLSLIQEPSKVSKLSEGALRVASKHTWDHLAEQIKKAYEIALASSRKNQT